MFNAFDAIFRLREWLDLVGSNHRINQSIRTKTSKRHIEWLDFPHEERTKGKVRTAPNLVEPPAAANNPRSPRDRGRPRIRRRGVGFHCRPKNKYDDGQMFAARISSGVRPCIRDPDERSNRYLCVPFFYRLFVCFVTARRMEAELSTRRSEPLRQPVEKERCEASYNHWRQITWIHTRTHLSFPNMAFSTSAISSSFVGMFITRTLAASAKCGRWKSRANIRRRA